MKDDGGSGARPAAGLGVANVRLEKLDPVRAVRKVRPLSVGKVVDSPDPGSPGQERVHQMRSDEAGGAGHEHELSLSHRILPGSPAPNAGIMP